jgi:GNAT superfamily N-acetyltransferase
MEFVTVRQCSAVELEHAPALPGLIAEYAAESTRADVGQRNPQFHAYRQMESSGFAKFVGAWRGAELVGFLVLVTVMAPHYGQVIATSESLFLSASARKSGAGKALIEKAQELAKECGAAGLFISAPHGGRLAQVLPRSGFLHTNDVFFKALQ